MKSEVVGTQVEVTTIIKGTPRRHFFVGQCVADILSRHKNALNMPALSQVEREKIVRLLERDGSCSLRIGGFDTIFRKEEVWDMPEKERQHWIRAKKTS